MPANASKTGAHIRSRSHIDLSVTKARIDTDKEVEIGVVDVLLVAEKGVMGSMATTLRKETAPLLPVCNDVFARCGRSSASMNMI